IAQDLLFEARRALIDRIAQHEANMELRTLLLTVERRLGSARAGEALIDDSRALADTSARYRLWLESAVAFHEEFGTTGEFLAAEQERLTQERGEWDQKTLERRLAFTDVAASHAHGRQAAAMLQSDIDSAPPQEFALRLRQQLIRVLEKDLQQGPLVQQQLAALAEENPEYKDEANARLAVLHARSNRRDLAQPLLGEIDLEKISDPALLEALKPLYRGQPDGWRQALVIAERLTNLNPTDRNNWEEWLLALAAVRDESRLRREVRRLLAGIEKMPLAEESQSLLRAQLADSYWRSISTLLAEDEPASFDEALVLLDSVERMVQRDREWLWVAWTRAWILNRLQRTSPRDAAIAELERQIAEQRSPAFSEKSGFSDSPMVPFPDGLSISLDHARRLLTAPPEPESGHRPGPRTGPLPPLRVKWDFETGSAAITAVVPIDEERLFVFDATGTGHCVDVSNGKLLWRRTALAAPTFVANAPSQQRLVRSMTSSGRITSFRTVSSGGSSHAQGPVSPLVDDQGRIFLAQQAELTCLSVEDGRLLWKARLDAVAPQQSAMASGVRPHASIFLYAEDVLGYDPVTGRLSRVDAETGKIVWDHALPTPKGAIVNAAASGASLHGDRLFVYGPRTAIVDVASGEVEWSFEPQRIRRLPVALEEPQEEPDAGTRTGSSQAMPSYGIPYSGGGFSSGSRFRYTGISPYGGRYGNASQRPPQFINYHEVNASVVTQGGEVALTAPAVAWAAGRQRGEAGWGELLDGRLLLGGPGELLLIPINLPFAGQSLPIRGRFVGTNGRVALVQAGTTLHFLDLLTGNTRTYNLPAA
ncbi:MAG: PQQ-binding-like beta-propeller repeat protein, partial [Planctomycetaceae bacterium]